MKVTGVPFGVEGVVGLMLIPVITAAVTDRLAVGEVIPWAEAVTVVLPTATPVVTPVVLLIVTIPVLADAHVTWLVMSAVVASEYVPVAVKWVICPLATVAVVGVMAMLARVTGVGVPLLVPPPAGVALPPPPHAVNNNVVTNQTSAILLCFVFIVRPKKD